MTSGKALKAAALLALGLIGCSDSVSKDTPIVDVNNVSNTNSSTNGATNNQSSNNSTNGTTNETPIDPRPALDLRADTNRDGVVSLTDPSDDDGEDLWGADHGAVFLANMDDDDSSCARSGSDASLAQCYDGNDDKLDGLTDLEDMAPLVLRATGDVPDTATATVSITAGADYAQFFVEIDGVWTATSQFTADASELINGVEFRLEGRDIVRNESWDGLVTVQAAMDGAPEATVTTDTVQLRVAPIVLRHHLDPARQIYSSELGIGGDGAFTQSLKAAVATAGVPLGHVELNVQDQWTQDFFETGYMAMPTPNGLKVIDVFIRSANIEQDFFGNTGLREAGKIVYTKFRGPDAAGITAVGGRHSYEWDTLNSFGNTETIPPFTYNGKSWPLGRILKGKAGSIEGDEYMVTMFRSQGVQDPLFIDTGWLLVGHVDETVSFLKVDSERGWVMLANDATMAVNIFQNMQQAGEGSLTVFQGRAWVNNSGRPYSAATTVSAILQDPDVMGASAEAAVEVSDQVAIIKQATGVTDAEILPVPFTHWTYDGASVAYQPGMVNGIVVNDQHFMAPDPHGPRENGTDVFEAAFQNILAEVGYEILFVEDWDMYHRLVGEIHCATNVVRDVNPNATQWWEMVR
ncbi:MAG: protein-arginine deiminase family protein [bacterium]